jgi:uncharacterized tellurite resistance protein B-like protein
MLAHIKQFIEKLSPDTPPSAEKQQHALQLATCVLLVEMGKVDGNFSEPELQRLNYLMEQQFNLTEQEKSELTELANQKLDQATDYYQFTSVLNRHFNQQQKIQVVEYLWDIAFVDGKIDAHEEHYLRKIHSLLHVTHSQFLQAKYKVEAAKKP